MNLDSSIKSEALYSVEYEELLIGSILVAGVHDSSLVSEVVAMIRPSDFFGEARKGIYSAICDVHEADGVVSSQSVFERLRAIDILDDVGGIDAIIEMIDAVPTYTHAKVYAKAVQGYSAKRRMIDYCRSAVERCKGTDDPQKIIADLAADLSMIGAVHNEGGMKSVGELEMEIVDELESSGEPLGGVIPTGYIRLDKMLTGGLRKSELTIIAARPSMGKTSFALNIAENFARNGTPTLVFSVEMDKRQLAIRSMATNTGISQSEIMLNILNLSDKGKLRRCAESFIDFPLHVDDSTSLYLTTMRSKLRDVVERFGIGAVFIDYLQIIPMQESLLKKPRHEAIGYLAKQLKCLAREFRIPVVALSQLSRSQSDSAGNPPTLDRLRDSGNIEEAADNVLMIHRPGYYSPEEPQNVSDVIIAKQRNGLTGKVSLQWIGNLTQFKDIPEANYSASGWTNN